MSPVDVESYVRLLVERGLHFLDGGKAKEIVVVDQREGLLADCEWAIFGHTNWSGNPDCPVALCSFRMAEGDPAAGEKLVVPKGWTFENSLSQRHRFVDSSKPEANLSFIRRDGGVDVYWDDAEKREMFVSRS